jgi:hypothetical protein
VDSSELQAFLTHTREDRWYPVWYTIASTGLRRSEICGLREESVDLERAVIVVDWKVVAVHHELYEGDPKSESSVREITFGNHPLPSSCQTRPIVTNSVRSDATVSASSPIPAPSAAVGNGIGHAERMASTSTRRGSRREWSTYSAAASTPSSAKFGMQRSQVDAASRLGAATIRVLHGGP